MTSRSERRMHCVNMRDCLQHAKTLLSLTGIGMGARFICHAIDRTPYSSRTQLLARQLITGSLEGEITVEGWLYTKYHPRNFSDRQIMSLRKRWIDELCAFLNREINNLDTADGHDQV
jgi:hypothetical protein